MIRGIHHVAICTPDLDRLKAFYVDVLGFEQVMSTSWRDRPIIDRMIGIENIPEELRVAQVISEDWIYPNDPRVDAMRAVAAGA